jgi:hypothetical protein
MNDTPDVDRHQWIPKNRDKKDSDLQPSKTRE